MPLAPVRVAVRLTYGIGFAPRVIMSTNSSSLSRIYLLRSLIALCFVIRMPLLGLWEAVEGLWGLLRSLIHNGHIDERLLLLVRSVFWLISEVYDIGFVWAWEFGLIPLRISCMLRSLVKFYTSSHVIEVFSYLKPLYLLLKSLYEVFHPAAVKACAPLLLGSRGSDDDHSLWFRVRSPY